MISYLKSFSLTRPKNKLRKTRAMTLVEATIAIFILGTFLLGFLSTALRSRRLTEGSVMQAAANSLVYGLIEQIKMLDFTETPHTDTATPTDGQQYDAFTGTKPSTPPYYTGLDVRLNQNQVTSLYCSYNATSPAPTYTPTSLTDSALTASMKNTIGPLTMSSTTGTQSQPLTLYIWAWVDDISNTSRDIINGKCVTLVYAYQYNDGSGTKTFINREVIVRTPFEKIQKDNG